MKVWVLTIHQDFDSHLAFHSVHPTRDLAVAEAERVIGPRRGGRRNKWYEVHRLVGGEWELVPGPLDFGAPSRIWSIGVDWDTPFMRLQETDMVGVP